MKIQESLSDKGALVNEITEKHDEVNRWKDKTRKSKEQAKHSKAQVVLREGTIKELRVTIRQLQKVKMHVYLMLSIIILINQLHLLRLN